MQKATVCALFLLATAGLVVPSDADAMCGCFMRRTPPPPTERNALLNKATVAVLMREGTHTVLSFSNDYFGPAEEFALLVPVPVVLRPEDVRTLDRSVFDRLQLVAAPHLVELYEQPPCPTPTPRRSMATADMAAEGQGMGMAPPQQPAVVVEAQFAQGEYDITILGASDSAALEAWLRAHNYHLPQNAQSVLRPYVEAGTKFFVARVDIERLRRVADERRAQLARSAQWMPDDLRSLMNGPPAEGVSADASLGRFLSPLRIHYESPELSLPVRLGLLSSMGEQDLVVHVLSPESRYEAANYGNRNVPTNVHVRGRVGPAFNRFYDAFFARMSSRAPRRVFTEYAGPIHAGNLVDQSCVGCTRYGITAPDLDALGDDVMPGHSQQRIARMERYVLTRLHYRYARNGLPDDLVFRAARPIAGGNESADRRGLRQTARRAQTNDFRVRFVAQNFWRGPVQCANPRRGRWGGQVFPGSPYETPAPWPEDRRIPLAQWIRDPVPALGLTPESTR